MLSQESVELLLHSWMPWLLPQPGVGRRPGIDLGLQRLTAWEPRCTVWKRTMCGEHIKGSEIYGCFVNHELILEALIGRRQGIRCLKKQRL